MIVQNRGMVVFSGAMLLAAGNVGAEVGNPRVNQIGYLPNAVKIATFKSETNSPQHWVLRKDGKVIAKGRTLPGIVDASSGDRVQQIDFSTVTSSGSGFTVEVGSNRSYPFSITSSVFRAPLYDAAKYFYHNRSGIAIDLPFTGGGKTSFAPDAKWARSAGHVNQGKNQGDFKVPCWPGTCEYALDVSKGWYDAGDHGKYVVNAGISVWTLMNMFERGLYWGRGKRIVDGELNIPESKNGVPDLLDEIRWELEFMLSMQVPQGLAKTGMVHHKVHDVSWTGLPLSPSEDPQTRALVPPSTAATLNLAAAAAQAARIWKDIDPAFSAQCLQAAKAAWNAAILNPSDLYKGGYDTGGGAYDDGDVNDEFYWAATELYLTTSDSQYLSRIDAYSIARSDFSWDHTALAGLISMATVMNAGAKARRAAAQQKIVAIADKHLAAQRVAGYSIPLTLKEFEWGSNGAVLNKLMLLGWAYTFTSKRDYANGVVKGVDYLFGRNAFSTSFVTGEGTATVKYPHHRFWAGVLNPDFPMAPPGAVSGGPNAKLQDPVAIAKLGPCVSRPATCWIDDINAYSVNEVAINWNAPLVWVLDLVNDIGSDRKKSAQ